MSKEKFSYVVIDNMIEAVQTLKAMTDKVPWLQQEKAFTDPFEGLDYLQKHPVDLLFLDIDMPGLLGTELLRMLQKPPVTILCTGHEQFALEGFELRVADYLLKPFSFERFYKGIEFARQMLHQPFLPRESLEVIRDDYIALPLKRGMLGFLHLQHINYIRADGDNCIVSVDPSCPLGESPPHEELRSGQEPTEKRIYINTNLGALEARLPVNRFFRIHRTYIVALDRIIKILPAGFVELSMPFGKRLNINDSSKKLLMHAYGSMK